MKYPSRRTKVQSKVAYRRFQNKLVEWISISGIWLRKAGFNENDSCDIKVFRNRLVIKKLPRPVIIKNPKRIYASAYPYRQSKN